MRAKPLDERPAGTTYVQELREGWDFLRRDPVLVAMTAMVAVTNLLDLAYSGVLLPVWVKDGGYGAGVLGAIFATWAAASAVGSFVAAWAAERMPRFQVYLWAFLITGLPRFVVLALGAPLWLVLATCVLGGFASGFLNPILGAVIYERVPDAVMGRVTTLSNALCWSLMPFGGLLGGVLSDSLGVDVALLIVGVAYLAATMVPLAIPSFRQFDKPKAALASLRAGGQRLRSVDPNRACERTALARLVNPVSCSGSSVSRDPTSEPTSAVLTWRGMTRISLRVDQENVSDDVEPRMLLVQYLREKLGKTGTVIGCDTSNCGACTVHLNGRSVKSCNVLAVQADGATVDTIERLASDDGTLHPVQEAFRECHGLQCGFCTPGMIMQAVDLLNENPNPTEEEVRLGLEGNLCRCTGYQNIVKSVLYAAQHGQPSRAPPARKGRTHDHRRGQPRPLDRESPRSARTAAARRTSA